MTLNNGGKWASEWILRRKEKEVRELYENEI
jgi:hypothetical protein